MGMRTPRRGTEDIAYVNVDYGDQMLANFHVNWLSPVKVRQMIFAGSRKSVVYNELNTTEPVKVYDRGIEFGEGAEGRRSFSSVTAPVMFGARISKPVRPSSRWCLISPSVSETGRLHSATAGWACGSPGCSTRRTGASVLKAGASCFLTETMSMSASTHPRSDPTNGIRITPDVQLGRDVIIHCFVNLYGCSIGEESRIGSFVEIQKNVTIGARCKISSHSFLCEGVTVEDEVFIGHGVMFINDSDPRATCNGRA